jgi:hypothetical protein
MQGQIGQKEGDGNGSDSSLLYHLLAGKERLNQLLNNRWERKISLFRHQLFLDLLYEPDM